MVSGAGTGSLGRTPSITLSTAIVHNDRRAEFHLQSSSPIFPTYSTYPKSIWCGAPPKDGIRRVVVPATGATKPTYLCFALLS